MDIVERVARAICKEGPACCENEPHALCSAMLVYEEHAKAAIEAMRKPSHAMEVAAVDNGTGHYVVGDPARVLGFMIDAELGASK